MDTYCVDFFEFLREARIGSVRLGDNRNEMLRVFGEPTHWEGGGAIPYEQSQIWCYGFLQLNLGKANEIASFMISYSNVYGDKVSFGQISFEDSLPPHRTTIVEFTENLVSNRIAYRIGTLNRVDHPVVQTQSGVFTVFTSDIVNVEGVNLKGETPVYSETKTIAWLRIDLDDDFWKVVSDSEFECDE